MESWGWVGGLLLWECSLKSMLWSLRLWYSHCIQKRDSLADQKECWPAGVSLFRHLAHLVLLKVSHKDKIPTSLGDLHMWNLNGSPHKQTREHFWLVILNSVGIMLKNTPSWKGGTLKGKQITKNSSAVPKATCSRGGGQAKLDF